LPPQSVQVQGAAAVAVRAKATTAMSANRIFFIFFSVEVSFQLSSASKDGSRRGGGLRLAAAERADGRCARARTRRKCTRKKRGGKRAGMHRI
jgi:hypothetical protein